jgi:predicted dehydrogenase
MSTDHRRTFLGHLAGAALTLPFVPQLCCAVVPRSRRIRVGQIGVGHAHASKLSVYRQSPEYEVVGIVEDDEALRSQAASRDPYAGLTWMSREQLLEVADLDVVLVETEVRDLLDTAEQCVAAGKHIHLDKPAGESLPQFRRLLNTAARQNCLVQMGYMYRYNPGFTLLREFVRQGWLGEIFEVHTVMSKVVDAESRAEMAQYPGGILFELGCHVLDLVIHLLGKPVAVHGYQRPSAITPKDGLKDNMLAVLEYDRAIATVKSTALEVEGFARRHLVVCGTKGTMQIQPLDDPEVRLALDQPQGDYRAGYQTIRLPQFTRYVADAADMARILRGEKESDFSYTHDLLVQETLLRACSLPLEV